jgi:hypothetical protein
MHVSQTLPSWSKFYEVLLWCLGAYWRQRIDEFALGFPLCSQSYEQHEYSNCYSIVMKTAGEQSDI